MKGVIKFRAWIPDIERMYQVYSIDTDSNGNLPKTVTVWEHPCYKSAVIKNKRGTFVLGSVVEVMQFTGLLDKNGVEIYEGDICSVPGLGNCEVKICPCYGVVFDNGGDYGESPYIDSVAEMDYPEVIGNIYENPELLKGEK